MADEDMLNRLRDLEGQISHLEHQTEIGAKVDKLQERIQGLETTRMLVLTIAVIFGVAGSWGLLALQTARAQLSDLKKGTQVISDAEQQAVADAKKQIRDYSSSELQNTLALSPDNNANEGCSQIKDLQICWGRQDAKPSPSDASNKSFDFQFKHAFSDVPVVAQGIDPDPLSSPLAFAVFQSHPEKDTYSGNVLEVKGRSSNGVVRVSYVAVGKWK